jgi:acyl-CoA dehydrogenase
MGGISFLEEYPMAKLHSDALVTAIWEGTSNI